MRRLAKSLAACALAVMMCMAVGFAEEHPGRHGDTNSAMVSDDHDLKNGADVGTNPDPNMGTKFTIYLPPDVPEPAPVVKDTPKMGDNGYDQKGLMTALLMAGGCYLVSDGVAVACRDTKRKRKAVANP